MRYTDGTAELYDMKADPNEFTNLATSRDYASVLKEMEATLSQRLLSAKIKN
jgi:hypothetical protein